MSKFYIDINSSIYKDNKLMPKSYTRMRNGQVDFIEKSVEAMTSRMEVGKVIIDEPCFYAGIKYNHFGHFLLESISRLSFYTEERSIVWSGANSGFTGYQKEILNVLNLSDKKHIFLNTSAEFNDLSIHERGYVIWDTFTKEHSSFLRVIEKDTSSKFFNKKIWLSRSGFKSYSNEWLIECILKNKGWLIVDPTSLSIKEQATLFSSAQKIAGVEGSAFHIVILCLDVCSDVNIYARRPTGLNGNYIKIDETMETKHNLATPEFDNRNTVSLDFIFNDLDITLNTFESEMISQWRLNHVNNSSLKISKNEALDKVRDLALSQEGEDLQLSLELMEVVAKYRPKGELIRKKIENYKSRLKN